MNDKTQNGHEVDFKLSIIMPAYNEAKSIAGVIRKLENLDILEPYEVIIVDDGSEDETYQIAIGTSGAIHTRVVQHPTNQGKGAAVKTGIAAARGSHILIFDADDEYDPRDIKKLIKPIVDNRAEVVYGARIRGVGTTHPTFVHAIGNRIMTTYANILFGSAISDLHTCLKLFPLPLLRDMKLTEDGFGLDTETTAEMLRRGWRPYELPVSYVGRSKEEGKKIKPKDALESFWILTKVRMRGKTRPGLRNRRLSPRVKTIENLEQ
jgi:glycosyltransferase involved in cell wall biosynthesis